MKNKIKVILLNKVNKVKNSINKLIDKLVEKNVKNLILDLKNYKLNEWLIFSISLPFSFIFVVINIIVFFIFIYFYILLFLFYLIKIKILKNKKLKIIKYKRRFKFLKNFYAIIIEKILITFPKKKAFLVFYLILKKIYVNDTKGLEINFIIEKIKAISNRYIVSFIVGIPFIILSCNNELIKIIFDLKDFNYTNKKAFINTVILNCYKNLVPEYGNLVEKLKISIKSKNITFNSLKEIIKASKYTKEFNEGFSVLKKKVKVGSANQKISGKKITDKHPTVILNLINNENEEKTSIYINESSKEELNVKRFSEEIQSYIDDKIKNNLRHKGSINKNTDTFYTPAIKTLTENIILNDPSNDKFLKKGIKDENINNIIAGLTINLDKDILETKKINIENKVKNSIIKEKTEKIFINWVKENKNKFNNETFESLLKIHNYWEENTIIISEMNEQNKLELAKIIGLNIKDMEDAKEVNFKIFISFLSEKK